MSQPPGSMPQRLASAGGRPLQSPGGSGTDVVSMLDSKSMQLARTDTRKNTVHACGRTILIPDAVQGLSALQSLLQSELGMQDQIFEVCDFQGKRLILDSDVSEAVADGRVPFTASLSDSSIHFIENRREELAQMQWKLVRDQHNQAQLKISAMVRQMTTVEGSMENLQRETAMSMDRLRSEMQAAIDASRGEGKAENRQLGERIAGVAQHVTAERNMREVSIQQFNKALQGVRDTIDADRTTVQQGVQLAMSQLSQTREMIDLERSAREALEYKHSKDLQSANDRMDEMAASLKNVMAEYGRRFEKASQEATEVIESHGRTALKTRSEMETTNSETAARLNLMEERCATLEQRMLEAQQRHNETMQRVNHKHEKFNTQVQQIKFDGGQQQTGISSMATKLQDVEVSLKTSEQEVRDVHERERRQMQDGVRSMREAIVSEYGRKLELLENKLAARIEREGESRQETLAQVIENVNVVLKKEGLQPMRQVVRAAAPVRIMTQVGPGGMQQLPVATQSLQVPSGPKVMAPGQTSVAMSLPAGAMQHVGPSGSALVAPGQAPGRSPMASQGPGQSPVSSVSMPPPMVVPTGSAGVQMGGPVMSSGSALTMSLPTTALFSSASANAPRMLSMGANSR